MFCVLLNIEVQLKIHPQFNILSFFYHIFYGPIFCSVTAVCLTLTALILTSWTSLRIQEEYKPSNNVKGELARSVSLPYSVP